MPRKPLLAALLLLFLCVACRAETPVTVTVNAMAAGALSEEQTASLPDALGVWAKWARLEGAPRAPVASKLPALAARGVGCIGVLVHNTTDEPARLRVEVNAPRGLWRVDAALVSGEDPAKPARIWRMESVWRAQPGLLVKPVTLPPGQTLCLRLTETVAAAQAAYKKTAAAKEEAGTKFLRGRVGRALAPVGEAVGTIAALVGKSDRAGVSRKTHRALLAAAQAQAVWKNGRGAALAERDGAFDELMTALSEISCAAYNLVPTQTEVVGADGKRTLRIGVTNAGPRTVPLVSLAVQGKASPLHAPAQRTVFGSLVPGEKVVATFPLTEDTAQGIVQFILGMGAAIVPASPLP